jgi:hypothetical protein
MGAAVKEQPTAELTGYAGEAGRPPDSMSKSLIWIGSESCSRMSAPIFFPFESTYQTVSTGANRFFQTFISYNCVNFAFLYFFHSSGMAYWNMPIYILKRRFTKKTTTV